MAHPVNDHALDVIFRDARTQNGFVAKDVPKEALDRLFDACPSWQFVGRTPSGRILPLPRGKASVRPRES